jgi:flagellar motility protein MotE (MotC chaperone)
LHVLNDLNANKEIADSLYLQSKINQQALSKCDTMLFNYDKLDKESQFKIENLMSENKRKTNANRILLTVSLVLLVVVML